MNRFFWAFASIWTLALIIYWVADSRNSDFTYHLEGVWYLRTLLATGLVLAYARYRDTHQRPGE